MLDNGIAPLLKIRALIRIFMQQHIIRSKAVVRVGDVIAYFIDQFCPALGLHDNGRNTLLGMSAVLDRLRTPGITEDDVGRTVAPSERTAVARRSADQAFDVGTIKGIECSGSLYNPAVG